MVKKIPVNLGNLYQAMHAQGITQKALAAHIGIRKETLSKKMTGKQDFTWSEMASICIFLNKPQISDLFLFVV